MFEIIYLTFKIVLILFLTGFGLTAFIIPKSLKENTIWFAPWLGLIFIVMSSVYLSMLGVTMEKASMPIFIFSLILFIYALYKRCLYISIKGQFFIVLGLTIFIYLFNIYPLLSKVGYATVLSLGNLDPSAYTSTADYLMKHSLFGNEFNNSFKPYLAAAGDFIEYSYRWGSVLIFSYFNVLLNVNSYQIYTILLTLFFALSYPLIYVLASLLYKKNSFLIALLTFLTFGINGTLLYMLYNAFFGQMVFVGTLILIIALFWIYTGENIKNKFLLFNSYELIIGLCLSSLTVLYPEGFIFALLPIGFYYFISFLKSKNVKNVYQCLRIIGFSILFNPFTFITTSRWYIRMFQVTTSEQVIGWEPIRFATPHEALGFWNLYYSRDLPFGIDLILMIIVISIIIIGFLQIKRKLVFWGYILFFGFACFFYNVIISNFFVYHRALTYSLFIYTTLFSIGMTIFLKKIRNKILVSGIVIALTFLVFRVSYRTWFQFYHHHRTVDKSLISLKELNQDKRFTGIIATSDIFYPEGDIWDRLWSFNFLPDKKILSRHNYKSVIKDLDSIPPVLYKKELYRNDPKTSFTNILWENKYYILGKTDTFPVHENLK
jgi:hypothetical protein